MPENAKLQNIEELLQQENYPEAIKVAQQSINTQPSAEGFHNLGVCLEKTGQNQEAISIYKKAVELNPDFMQSHNNLAALYEKIGNIEKAIDHYQIATILSPSTSLYWSNLSRARMSANRFYETLTAIRFTPDRNKNKNSLAKQYTELFQIAQDFEITPCLINEVLTCLKAKNIDTTYLTKISQKIFLQQDIVKFLIPKIEQYEIGDFDKLLKDRTLNWGVLNNDLSTAMLSRLPVQSAEIEALLTTLRAHCLESLSKDNSGNNIWDHALTFLNALACQCFINEYIFFENDEESSIISKLEQRIINGENLTLYDIAIYASYRPLHKLPRANDLLKSLQTQNIIKDMVHMQLSEPLQEIAIKQGINNLTSIDDEVSNLVKEQYETNPYPRWINTSIGKSLPFKNVMQHLFPYMEGERFSYINSTNPKTLIAGCGTGKQAIDTALTFENSDILAIDLSASSIAYATRKTKEYNLKNIKYGIADILKINELKQEFDVIQSVGVLHHMQDPIAGWKALYDILKPGGFMLVAVYSDIARQSINAAREFIEQHNFTSDIEGIRLCRETIQSLPDSNPVKPVTSWMDFYTASTCRDLIFHVQEQCYTTPQLKNILSDISLEFLGFHLPQASTLAQYAAQFPDDLNGTNLKNWHKFEKENPHTFKAMYQMWLQKPYN